MSRVVQHVPSPLHTAMVILATEVILAKNLFCECVLEARRCAIKVMAYFFLSHGLVPKLNCLDGGPPRLKQRCQKTLSLLNWPKGGYTEGNHCLFAGYTPYERSVVFTYI